MEFKRTSECILISCAIFSFGAFMALMGYSANHNSNIGSWPQDALTPETMSKVNAETGAKDETSDWKEYLNTKLGFSIWLPNKAFGENSEFVAMNILEDNKNNVVYFGTRPDMAVNNGWKLKIAVKSVKN